MTRDATTLLADALKLPERERGDLAARLIDSLDPAADDEIETAWDAEIGARIEELRTGHAQPAPWPEARRLILGDVDESGPA